jgi:flavin reductase (DIM6/NTAB) family NADH-FMN oxidoreductase RutF
MDKDIDPGSFWRLLGMRAIGAAVVTAQGSAGPAGFLALSATHVTAKPPTMLVSVGRKTSALSAVTESGSFAINYLPREREDLARLFGGQGDDKGADRFKAGEWTTLTTGSPVLAGAVGSIDCRVEEAIERHDTLIFLGRIVDWSRHDDARPLISYSGGYL